MTFYDDEKINDDVETQELSTEEEAIIHDAGPTWLIAINQPEAPFEETELKVLLELTGSGKNEDRPPVDFVMVLDISKSMEDEDKIKKLKTAMQFLIQKLGPIDRLSVVTFSSDSERLFPLRQITNDSQKEIIDMVNRLEAKGGTNIFAGLTKGVEVLKYRRYNRGRLGAILLMSDGSQGRKFPDARKVEVDSFAVHTFGFGSDAKPKVLQKIADNSKGGTFSNVPDVNDLAKAFSQCLGGLLTVLVKDLNLTITQFDKESKIKNVRVGSYPKSVNDSSVTVSFGELYNNEVRNVMVYIKEEKSPDVLKVAYKFSSGKEKPFEAPPLTVGVNRKGKATVQEIPKLILEENRLMALNSVKEAICTADNGDLERAKNIVDEAKNKLEQVKVDDDPTELIKTLTKELQQLSDFMTTPDDYEKYGRPYGMAFETSHDRQRHCANGLMDDVRSYATARIKVYLKQAKKFDLDPNTPPETEKDNLLKDPKPLIPEPPIDPTPIPQPPTPIPEPPIPPEPPTPIPQPQIDPTPIPPEPPTPIPEPQTDPTLVRPIVFINKVLNFLADLLKRITRRLT